MLSSAHLAEPASRIPEGLTCYKRTPVFTQASVPAGLLRAHSTKEGVWGRIRVLEGALLYRILDARRCPRELVLTPAAFGVVEPTILHEVEPAGPVRFQLEFFR